MSFAYPLTGIVTLLSLLVYFRMAMKVGRSRGFTVGLASTAVLLFGALIALVWSVVQIYS